MKPPALELSSELRWVLARAFGPRELAAHTLDSPAHAVELARTLDLAARIASRHSHYNLQSELGQDEARKLQMLRLRVVALNQILSRTTSLVVQCAARLGIAVVRLKHSALCAIGVVEVGSRDARDVDLLVDQADAQRLQDELQAQGFKPVSEDIPKQHLPTLIREEGEVVEVHHMLSGLALPGAGSERAASALIAAGYATAQHGAQVPVPALLSAHLLVHGLVQHRTATELYPALRLMCDLCDLDFAQTDDSVCRALVAPELSHETMDAVRALTALLAAGEDPRTLGESSQAFELFSHLVAGALDPDYQQALFLEGRHLVSAVRGRLTSLSRASHPPSLAPSSKRAEVRRIAVRLALSCAGYARLALRRGRPLRI
jgi:Uncharacterised nucleotidyltransferase